jgi:pantothenate kinase
VRNGGGIVSLYLDFKEAFMATTFLKRQKEMKRLEKQREKAERRAQKKLSKVATEEPSVENMELANPEVLEASVAAPAGQEPHN